MIRFLVRTAIFLVSAAIGLLVTAQFVDGVEVTAGGFLAAVVIFAVIQSILAPWVFKLTRRHAAPLLGGIGIISTFIAILIVVLIPGAGVGISEPLAWVLAPVIVWIITALATWLLPMVFLKKDVAQRRAD